MFTINYNLKLKVTTLTIGKVKNKFSNYKYLIFIILIFYNNKHLNMYDMVMYHY